MLWAGPYDNCSTHGEDRVRRITACAPWPVGARRGRRPTDTWPILLDPQQPLEGGRVFQQGLVLAQSTVTLPTSCSTWKPAVWDTSDRKPSGVKVCRSNCSFCSGVNQSSGHCGRNAAQAVQVVALDVMVEGGELVVAGGDDDAAGPADAKISHGPPDRSRSTVDRPWPGPGRIARRPASAYR